MAGFEAPQTGLSFANRTRVPSTTNSSLSPASAQTRRGSGATPPPIPNPAHRSKRREPRIPVASSPRLLDYKIHHLISADQSGRLYAAEERAGGRRVAIKFMSDVVAKLDKAERRFAAEAIAASSINHPGVVEVYERGHDRDGVEFLAMEFLEGETLDKRMAREPLTDTDFIEVGVQLLDVLAAAHRKGIIHRGINPDKIFLQDGPGIRVKLLDFGVAKFEDASMELTSGGHVLGLPTYYSPEQCLEMELDSRSDIYSLGCVFFEMLTQRTPFRGDLFEIFIGHTQIETPSLRAVCPTIAPALASVVEKMMMKKPSQRFDSADAASAALGSIAFGNHTAAHQMSLPNGASLDGESSAAFALRRTSVACASFVLGVAAASSFLAAVL